MFAGKTEINKAMIAHAAMRVVCGNNNNKANNISQKPLINISSSCQGSQWGIIFL